MVKRRTALFFRTNSIESATITSFTRLFFPPLLRGILFSLCVKETTKHVTFSCTHLIRLTWISCTVYTGLNCKISRSVCVSFTYRTRACAYTHTQILSTTLHAFIIYNIFVYYNLFIALDFISIARRLGFLHNFFRWE